MDKAGFLIPEETAGHNEDRDARLVHRNEPLAVDEAGFLTLCSRLGIKKHASSTAPGFKAWTKRGFRSCHEAGKPPGDQDGRFVHEKAGAVVDEAAFLVLGLSLIHI